MIRANAESRHTSHSVYGRSSARAYGWKLALGHPDFVSEINRHPSLRANSSIAGNHSAAWESPNNTMVVADDVSPYVHRGQAVSKNVR